MVFNSVCSEERREKILATTNPSFVSVGNCSEMYRCNFLFSSVGEIHLVLVTFKHFIINVHIPEEYFGRTNKA